MGCNVGVIIFLLLTICFVIAILGIHKIPEGYVGIYYQLGRLQKSVSEPGFSTMIPFITQHDIVQITVQTDEVRDIPCGTSGGVMIQFGKIEVVNKLQKNYVYDTIKNYTTNYDKIWIYDKIHHEINQFCTHHSLHEVVIDLFDTLDENLMQALLKDCEIWAPGIEILAIRVTKPTIPSTIQKLFENIEAERVLYMKKTEVQRTEIQKKEADKVRGITKAKSDLEVAKVNIEKRLNQKKNEMEITKIQNEMYLNSQKSIVDGEYYRQNKELETLKEKLNTEYLRYLKANSITTNLTIYFGDSIPNVILSNPLDPISKQKN